jgi:hypothetical protein
MPLQSFTRASALAALLLAFPLIVPAQEAPASAPASAPAAAPASAPASAPAADDPAAATCEFPALLVDVGQGNNAKLLQAVMRRNGAPEGSYTLKEVATEADLEGIKTLVIGVGASTKGLGAAGLDVATESARAKALMDAAKKAGIKVVGVHIGGIPRRGELSDTFNAQVLKGSDLFLFSEDGNEDGFFTRLAEAEEVPVLSVETKAQAPDLLKKLFGLDAPAK